MRQMGAKTSGNFWHIILGHGHCGGVGAQRIEIIRITITIITRIIKKAITRTITIAITIIMIMMVIMTTITMMIINMKTTI